MKLHLLFWIGTLLVTLAHALTWTEKNGMNTANVVWVAFYVVTAFLQTAVTAYYAHFYGQRMALLTAADAEYNETMAAYNALQPKILTREENVKKLRVNAEKLLKELADKRQKLKKYTAQLEAERDDNIKRAGILQDIDDVRKNREYIRKKLDDTEDSKTVATNTSTVKLATDTIDSIFGGE
ncbi:hypothetical protein M3Y94_00875200 [Aphelenchoides besseyi]|nr:hypothetical protein M3Y94_00875200 [Aphelenchoides besseyi]KAI6226614.1 hypothetical protein M3Y95_00639300 [Aphelenchoides besseyi]